MERMTTIRTTIITLLVVLISMPIFTLGCQEEELPPTPVETPVQGIALSSTLVPNTDFDVYVYVKQPEPTVVLQDMLGTPFDISVDSLALWGIATEETFALSGGLTLATAREAAELHSQIPEQSEVWTSLSDVTIYFVYGTGAAEAAFKTAISSNDFKYYDNQQALYELSLFPDGGETRMAGVAIVEPSETVVKLLAKYAAPDASDLMEVLLKTANLQVLTAGIYSAKQVDIAEIAKNMELTSILELDVGILASAKSAWPGLVVNPIVSKALEAAGYTKVALGELIIYKGYLDLGDDKTVPVMFRVKDNRLFTAVSGNQSYAETLLINLNI